MASKVDLGQQFQLENVSHLPPRPPVSHLPPRPPAANGRPCSGGFHNRGGLFSTIRQQHTQAAGNEHLQGSKKADETNSSKPSTTDEIPTPKCEENTVSPGECANKKRIHSAQARLEHTTKKKGTFQNCHAANHNYQLVNPASDVAVYDVNINLAIEEKKPVRRRSSASIKSGSTYLPVNKSSGRPSSAKSGNSWSSSPISPAVEENPDSSGPEDLKPSVYGYRFKRKVYGSNPDIFTAGSLSNSESVMFKLDKSPTRALLHTTACKSITFDARKIPSHMEPLRPWLTDTVNKDVIGMDPVSLSCLIFLPLNQSFDNLPIVPLS